MRTTGGALIAIATMLAMAGCEVPDKGVRVAGTTSAALAVGAKYGFAVIDACEYAGPGFIILGPQLPLIIPTPPTCLSTTVDRIVSVTFSDPSVVRVVRQGIDHGGAVFEIEVTAPGTTTFAITIRATEGLEYTARGSFTAERVTSVGYDGICEVMAEDATDELAVVGQPARFRPRLIGTSGAELAGYGYLPMELDGAPLVPTADGGYVVDTTAPGTHVVTSSVDPQFRKTIEVVTAAQATDLRVRSAVPGVDAVEIVERDLVIESLVRFGGRGSCFPDRLPRRVVVETPTVCGLHDSSSVPPPTTVVAELPSTTGGYLAVRGLVRDQTCRVRTELLGTAVTSTLALPVREGWTLMTPPAGIAFTRGAATGPDAIVVVGMRNLGSGGAPRLKAALAEWNGTTWTAREPGIPADATETGRLDGVSASGGTVFAVGSGGAVLRRIGTGAWTLMPAVTTEDLLAVHAISPTEVIAVGAHGTVVRFTGGAWRVENAGVATTSTLRATWGSGPDDLWVAGEEGLVGVVRRFDGVAWQTVDTTPFLTSSVSWEAVWGSGPTDVYVGGNGFPDNALLHWDGAAWSVAARERALALWGSGPDEVYAAGKIGFGEILRWDGEAWLARNIAQNFIRDVWGAGPAQVYVIAYVNELHRYR